VILVRHGATFADQADTDPFNFDNISAQRNLNDNGKALELLVTVSGSPTRAGLGFTR
jgi:hypothetical protein